MEFSYKKVVIRRFLELFVTNLFLSLLLIYANLGYLLNTKEALSMGFIAGTAVFLYINVRMLRNCYFDLEGKSAYYSSNVIAYLSFTLLSMFAYFFVSNEIYTWVFALTKFVRYINSQISAFISICIFHILGILSIYVAPLGMGNFINERIENEQIM